MLKSFFLALVLFSFSTAFAKTLVITDIDDTIRIRHVQHKLSSGFKLMFRTQTFLGMSELYRQIIDSNADSKVYYVTNSGSGDNQWNFLDEKGFPLFMKKNKDKKSSACGVEDEPVCNREDSDNKNFKIEAITAILNSQKPERVIFIGDNSESDPEYYRTITEKYKESGIEFITFIRALYDLADGKKIEEPQIAFVTPIEIAIELSDRGLFAVPKLQELASTMLIRTPSMRQEMEYQTSKGTKDNVGRPAHYDLFYGKDRYFESWQKCDAFQWRWEDSPSLKVILPKMASYFTYLKNRGCDVGDN